MSIYRKLIVRKCAFCGGVIMWEPVEGVKHGQEVLYCSEECLDLSSTYSSIRQSLNRGVTPGGSEHAPCARDAGEGGDE